MHPRISLHQICFSGTSLTDAARQCAALGVRRLTLTGPALLAPDGLADARAALLDQDLELESIAHLFHAGPLTAEASSWRASQQALDRLIDAAAELGARYVGLVHDGDNDLARSARPSAALGDPAESSAGVSALGAEAIARMNRLGIMVDVSHGAKQTALDAMRLSAAPIIASHSGIATVNAHPRNMDDETLLALKADGGVVQVVAYDSYLKQQPEEKTAAVRALRQSVGLAAGARP